MKVKNVKQKNPELRFRVSAEVKQQLDKLGEISGVSANKMAIKLIAQGLEKEPDLQETILKAKLLADNLEPLYFRIFGSYSCLKTARINSDSFLERAEDFKKTADFFVGELNRIIDIDDRNRRIKSKLQNYP